MKWPSFPWRLSCRWQYTFQIALCARQLRVWDRYHIMSPVYVSVIYFCIRSLVRHHQNTVEHFNRAFPTNAVRKSTTDTKVTEKLSFPIGDFCSKIQHSCHHDERYQRSIAIVSWNSTVPSFGEQYQFTVLYQLNCGYDGTKRTVTECDMICYEKNKNIFFLSSDSVWPDVAHVRTSRSASGALPLRSPRRLYF